MRPERARTAIVKAPEPIGQAAGLDAAADARDTFEIEWGDRYPAIVDLWRRSGNGSRRSWPHFPGRLPIR